MDLSPHEIRTASFATSRKGFDPDEVATFQRRAAEALESAQNQAAAMEAKARGAVAKLQELSAAGAPVASPAGESVPSDRADEISRTLLLAQRAADEAMASATAESERLLEVARERSAKMIDEARAEARAAGADEHEQVRGEVDELLARRDFLTADVDQLESFLVDQRARLREAAATLVDLAERPGGLGQVRAPLMSAVEETAAPDASSSRVADGSTGGDAAGDVDADLDAELDDDGPHDPGADVDVDDAATQAMPLIRPLDVDNADPTPQGDPEQLRFRPDAAGRGDPTSR